MKRREWLAFGAVFLLFAVLVFLNVSQQPAPDPYGLNSSRPEGIKGFYLLLEQVGFAVDKARQLEGNSGAGLALFPTPYEADVLAEPLLDWIEAGNVLVILGDPQIQSWDNERIREEYLAFAEDESFSDSEKVYNLRCFDYVFGGGIFRVIPDGEICTNEVLRKEDNAVRLLNALRDLAGKNLYFLDLTAMAQPVKREAETIWEVIPAAIWLIIFQLGLGFYLWRRAKTSYLGQPITTENDDIPAEDEDILALGRLLREHKQNKAVLEWLYQLFREDVAITLGVAPAENNDSFMAQAELEYPADRAELLGLQRIREQKSVSDKDLLQAEHIMRRIRERRIETYDRAVLDSKTR